MSRNSYQLGPNILLVEDDEAYGKALSRLLSDESNHLEQVQSCEDALSTIAGREDYFDVIILDHGLKGGKTGLECLRVFKALDIPAVVIVLTGLGNRELGVEMLREGAFRYFTKQSENDDELLCAIEVAHDLAKTKKGNKSMEATGKIMNTLLLRNIAISLVAIVTVIALNFLAPENVLLSTFAICALMLVIFFSISGVRKFASSEKFVGCFRHG